MKKKSILVIVWLVLLVSLGINGYQYYKKRETDKSATSRLSIRNFKDSVNKVIADLELSLEHMALLQNDNKEMVAAIAMLEARSPKTIIKTNTIDPNKETADVDTGNNQYPNVDQESRFDKFKSSNN